MLGVTQRRDPPVVAVAPKKVQELMAGIRYVLDVRKCLSSHELERIVGHTVFSSLLRLEALSILHGCYRFCRKQDIFDRMSFGARSKSYKWLWLCLPLHSIGWISLGPRGYDKCL
eukprot:5782025-Amphidinium_carterae.5